MGMHNNPLGYAGYGPNVTGTPSTQEANIRAASSAEISALSRNDVYMPPSAIASVFASPPAIGNTTPAAGSFTTLTNTLNATFATSAAATLVDLGNVAPSGARTFNIAGGNQAQNDTVNILAGAPSAGTQTFNLFSGVATGGTQVINLGTGSSAKAINIGAASDTIAFGNGISVTAPSVAGSSPIINNERTGQASFTDVINTTAYGTLTITNSTITASSVIIATASCVTVNSACVIADIVPGSGTVAIRVYNAGSANTADNIIINFWVLN